ncbi:hypothetical protein UFOVP1301_48 [uncultured Caudovirales phage]|uniref:Uncharacterized protein n=1 Tax=uncultured Caudovirales phage TaxID=2100421 RepID=A0A6J5PHI3_9CAUD|nr:hypothetical protein UFOVP663_33 [uncultured Caudovirales phage]CAB4168618.1 hypothetical protein UFOVP894_9 [uncultured Caudovirales phage]CAB4181171.1 hypothetical protein UFOVP1069_19 [uncultured Caudovirales phage]CAB4195996.1 hypothetical protein UFOVP1301_48 [uncultured Caudovirales phage]CAB4211018.1 hypothetical protein UFOVP1415_66 [uncultured Caudovirales phage]
MINDRAKAIRSALLTAYNTHKAGGGKIIPHGDPQRDDNLAEFMRGANRAVLNKDKSPKVFYHGTTVPDDFSEFSLGQPNYTEEEHGESYRRIYTHNDPTTYLGSHFAEEPEVANKFARGLYGEAKDAKEGNRVIPVHLNIKKPLVTTESNMISSMLRHPYDHPDVEQQFNNDEDAERYYHPDEIDYRISKNKMALKLATEDDSSFAEQMAEKYKNRLIENGYDGVKYKNEVEGGNSWIAFHPNQIKSAVGNRGTFDPNEPDITKAGGGDVDLPMDDALAKNVDLPMDEANRMERAQEMGANLETPLFHGTPKKDLTNLSRLHGTRKAKSEQLGEERGFNSLGIWLSNRSDKSGAEMYAGKEGAIFPVYSLAKKPFVIHGQEHARGERDVAFKKFQTLLEKLTVDNGGSVWNRDMKPVRKWFADNGYDSVILKNTYGDAATGGPSQDMHIILDDKNVRSKFAKFDPKLAHESDIGAATGGFIHDPEKAKRYALMIARGLHKAAGGDVEEDKAPASSGKTITNALPGQPTRTFIEPKHGNEHVFAVTDPDKDVTTKSLAAETNAALAHHMSLPQGQQIANSKASGNKLAPYVGRDDNGDVKPFLTMNAKLEKASAGYEAGKGYEGVDPLKLEGGIGVKTIGLPLSPSYQHKKYKVCANASSCGPFCLGQHSGNYSNADWWPQQNSLNKTHAFLSEPGALIVQLHNEIKREKYAAEMQGNKLAVRMNVLSDTDPRVWESLIKQHPDVDFYDYTKMNYDPIARNHHYTYSSTGVSQPKENTGLDKDIYNPNQNWKQMRQRLDTGSNVAMVFTHNNHLPNEVHDQETGKKYRVIDGTTHDYRPLDKQPKGYDGVIVGLRNLDHRQGRDVAAEKSKGFMVHYDPKIQMVPNKRTGEPTKTAMKDDNGATIPTNRTVVIAPQSIAPKSKDFVPHNQREGRAHGGAVEGEMPPEYAIQQFHNFDKFNGSDTAPASNTQKYAYGGPVEGDVVRRALNLTRQTRS